MGAGEPGPAALSAPQPRHVQSISHSVAGASKPSRSLSSRHASRIIEIFHAERHSGQRSGRMTTGDAPVDFSSGFQGTRGVEADEGVQFHVADLDGGQGSLDEFNRGHAPVTDRRRSFLYGRHLHVFLALG